MAALSEEQVRHIAKLARLELRDDEIARFTKELQQILAYVEQLQKVDTRNVEPTEQVTGRANVLRHDVLRGGLIKSDDIIACSALPVVAGHIRTPSAHAGL